MRGLPPSPCLTRTGARRSPLPPPGRAGRLARLEPRAAFAAHAAYALLIDVRTRPRGRDPGLAVPPSARPPVAPRSRYRPELHTGTSSASSNGSSSCAPHDESTSLAAATLQDLGFARDRQGRWIRVWDDAGLPYDPHRPWRRSPHGRTDSLLGLSTAEPGRPCRSRMPLPARTARRSAGARSRPARRRGRAHPAPGRRRPRVRRDRQR
jgi:hypothetical protein